MDKKRIEKAVREILAAVGEDVKRKDIVVAGADQVAVDAFGATLLGFNPSDIGYVVEGHARGIGNMNFQSLSPLRLEV